MGAALLASWYLIVAIPVVVGVVVENNIANELSESDLEEVVGDWVAGGNGGVLLGIGNNGGVLIRGQSTGWEGAL